LPQRAIFRGALKFQVSLLVIEMGLGWRPAEENMSMLRKFLRSETGATAIEYSLICAFIALVIITAVGSVGGKLVTIFAGLVTAFG
jgi:pilus assembly protein Flp/PilA